MKKADLEIIIYIIPQLCIAMFKKSLSRKKILVFPVERFYNPKYKCCNLKPFTFSPMSIFAFR